MSCSAASNSKVGASASDSYRTFQASGSPAEHELDLGLAVRQTSYMTALDPFVLTVSLRGPAIGFGHRCLDGDNVELAVGWALMR